LKKNDADEEEAEAEAEAEAEPELHLLLIINGHFSTSLRFRFVPKLHPFSFSVGEFIHRESVKLRLVSGKIATKGGKLVIDRETGKPKGYGFCEYKDEETALSARRNLQGYEINGRQLRVDFAENDKNTDRNREQGRGGPGMVANIGPQKQTDGPAVVGDSGFHQPIGLQVAMAAASVMAGVLGGSQASGLQGQLALYSDPLTLHLAKMSRNQLNEVMSELKVIATENKEKGRQLLLAIPQLPKALFQAQIMLGMVTQQMLQMPNIRQASGLLTQSLSQDGQPGQQPAVSTLPGLPQPAVSTLPGLPPLAQNKMHFGLIPREQEAQVPSLHPNPLAQIPYFSLPQFPTQSRVQLPQLVQNQVLEQSTLPGYSGTSTLPSIRPPLGSASAARPQIPVPTSSYVKQQIQRPLLQTEGLAGSTNIGHNSQLIAPNAIPQTSLLIRPLLTNENFQPGVSIQSGTHLINKDSDRSVPITNVSTWVHGVETYSSLPSRSSKDTNMVNTSDPMSRPSKMAKLDEGRSTLAVGVNMLTSVSGPSQVSGNSLFGNQITESEEAPNSQKKAHSLQLPPEVESALLQQVLSLTPEQLSSLPPDQQQQVIQLQQILR
ncbi:hypothetical protein U1Q18_017616, partial [Sarracenia purpurea var. burkii]